MTHILVVKWGNKRPTEAIFINIKKNKIINIPMWADGRSIKEALKSEEVLKATANNLDELLIVNYKDYLKYFGMCCAQKLYDYPLEYNSLKQAVISIYKELDELFKEWQEIRADAAEVYQMLEDRGVYYEHKKVYPIYGMNVYSGRSKTTGFNIQGTNNNFNIRHSIEKYKIFVSFDWIAADARIGGILSEDDELNRCYEYSDPYTYIEKSLGSEISRDECKLELNKSVNSLSGKSEIFMLFPRYGKWIDEQVVLLRSNGFSRSILGRKFVTDGTIKGDRRSFNSILQGSVAHAMQKVIFRVNEACGDIILTEQHDSLTICTSENRAKSDIDIVSKIMLQPFDGKLKNIKMPLRIEVGKSWCKYSYLKECR